jgi:HEPN domain-containing protein
VERVPFDETEYRRWLAHAEHTLAAARADLEAKFFSWACFKAQQVAEYALKGVLRGAGAPALGHSVLQLLTTLAEGGSAVPEGLLDCARVLDRFYIPTRYADAFEQGSPFQYFAHADATRAIDCARQVVGFVVQEKGRNV